MMKYSSFQDIQANSLLLLGVPLPFINNPKNSKVFLIRYLTRIPSRDLGFYLRRVRDDTSQ